MAANPVSSAAGVTTTSKSNSSKKEKETLLAVLQFLKKNKLPETEKILRQEANCFDSLEEINLQTTPDAEPDISSVLSAYNSDADPTRYEDYYSSLQAFVEKSLDVYKPELAMVLYPMFVHMYLELLYKGSEKEAQSFFACFRGSQEDYHEEDLSKLAAITRREHMKSNELMGTLRSNKFVIRMSKDTYQVLKKHLQDQQQEVLLTLIQQHLHFDVFEGRPRSKQTIEATAGAVTGEATFEGSMAENLVNSIEKKGLEDRLRAVEGQIKVLKLEEVAHNEEKVRLRNKVTKVFEEMKSVKEDFEDRMKVMKVFEEMKSIKEDFESIRHDIQDLEWALKKLQFLQASNCLGEVGRQLQNNMYQYVFPQSFSPIGNYKVKNIHRDVNQFPNTATGEEKLQARKRWSELQKKLNWNETYEVAVKLLQENGTHQKISFKLLQEAPDILDEQGSLKGPLSRACIDGLIHMWKQFQIVAH